VTYKDIMAAIGTAFSVGCLSFILWSMWSGFREAVRREEFRRKVNARLLEMGPRLMVDSQREELVN
jgi:hypothetical protein